MMKNLFFCLLFISLPIQAALFGVDDRVSITPMSAHYSLAKSTAIAILSSHYEKLGNGRIRVHAEKATNLCPSEKFSKELNLSYACSGFLVAPDLIVTAGHCMVNTGETSWQRDLHCKAYSWLFDYHLDNSQKIDYDSLNEESLYHCKQIVYAVREEQAPYRDYALVQLDRKVVGRHPIQLKTLASTQMVSMIGHPHGLTSKRSAPSSVLHNDLKRQSFITSLDAFQGNSGSVVLNHRNEAVGILIGGTPSHGMIPDSRRPCDIYNRCNQQGKNCSFPDEDTSVFPGFQRVGSEVQRIEPIINLINEFRAQDL